MDIDSTNVDLVQSLIDTADRRITIKKQLASIKSSSLQKLILHKNGGIFTIDRHLIGMVHALISISDEFVVLDDNNNPVVIKDGKIFYRDMMTKHQEVLNKYAKQYNDIRQSKVAEIYE